MGMIRRMPPCPPPVPGASRLRVSSQCGMPLAHCRRWRVVEAGGAVRFVAGSATWTAEIAPLAEAKVERLPATGKILRTIGSSQACWCVRKWFRSLT